MAVWVCILSLLLLVRCPSGSRSADGKEICGARGALIIPGWSTQVPACPPTPCVFTGHVHTGDKWDFKHGSDCER